MVITKIMRTDSAHSATNSTTLAPLAGSGDALTTHSFASLAGKRLRSAAAMSGIAMVGLGFARTLVSCYAYADLPGFSEDYSAGRTKNGVATLVGGIIGQRLHGESEIELTVEKSWFPDASLRGYTSRDSINVTTELALTSSHFSADRSPSGDFAGTVEKSEFNWEVQQTAPDTWKIGRFGLKLDSTLTLQIRDGCITGSFSNPMALDWTIGGTYDSQGQIDIQIESPLMLPLRLTGTIRPR